MSTTTKQSFLTVEQAFDFALDSLTEKIQGKERVRIYIWRKRYKDGKLSHKKISDILSAAGFAKVVEERWIVMPEKNMSEEELNEPFKD